MSRVVIDPDDDRFAPDPSISDETLEWLFQPRTYGELFCRIMGPDEFERKLGEAAADTSPDNMPHRFRRGPIGEGLRCVYMERIYQEEKRRRRVARNGT